VGHAIPTEALEWLGHAPLTSQERAGRLRKTFKALNLPADALGPLTFVAEHGPDYSGRYELVFAALRRALASVRTELRQLLESKTTTLLSNTALGNEIDRAFNIVMSLDNLVAVFGDEATRNPRHSFASHFSDRTGVAVARFAPRTNPFLWQIFAGRFPGDVCWDWLEPEGWNPPTLEPEFIHAGMLDALQQLDSESADLVHLSNILDWLSLDEATAVLLAARRVLRPGGMVLLRQLNSSLDIPALPSGLNWDADAGASMEARDRSFFYPLLHLGRKQ
jgi:S-adenosylmethionine-diacylglycerol 3-amino-3-carboxypropyl transferase